MPSFAQDDAGVPRDADPTPPTRERIIEFRFTPTSRMQMALWIQSADGSRFTTVRLTESVSFYGIGNRPGALQMNSGFRWPYGRREGALPIWAHARVASGGELFNRVIFQNRTSEGLASRTSEDSSTDTHFCLSFRASASRREALDAVSCASIFNSDKGRYLTEADVDTGYAEPHEDAPMLGTMLPLRVGSYYPPRRDLAGIEGRNLHPDITTYRDHVYDVMPDIDTVSMATPQAAIPQRIVFSVPEDWPDGVYHAYLEANVEGDYNEAYSDLTYPTPRTPSGKWDNWAIDFGYAYRGQPSVLYHQEFRLGAASATFESDEPSGYGSLDGSDGDIRPIDSSITVDHASAPGSGGDRLLLQSDGTRFALTTTTSNLCAGPTPPAECDTSCSESAPCAEGFLCNETGSCVGLCDAVIAPASVGSLIVSPDSDKKHSHEWARLSFTRPSAMREIAAYEVRYSVEPIVDETSFLAAQPAKRASAEIEGLQIPVEGAAGAVVDVGIGGFQPQTHYYVGVRATDQCNSSSALAFAEFTTSEIHFTTVTPCFVSTAAYGSAMANEVKSLRRFRDRYLATHAPGRAFVRAYYAMGPALAEVIRDNELLRSAARATLGPVVAIASWLSGE